MTEASINVTNQGAPKAAALTGVLNLNDAFEIDLSKRIPWYSNVYVGAYAAKSNGADQREFIAYVCDSAYTPRARTAATYVAVSSPSLARLIASGTANLVGKGTQKYVFVYENTLGKPIADTDMGLTMGMKSERVMEKFVVPLVAVLKDFRDRDFVHGAIRPTNLFDGGKENYDIAILGDCLSIPASMAQPAIFEPIDRGLAQPSGRGVGVNADDLYSFGVTLACILRSRDPMKGKSEADIQASKIQNGSYATFLSPDDHFTGSIVELLRGLLIDDRRQRWTMDDVLVWRDGRRLSPKQSVKKPKASRSLTFNGKPFTYPALLAKEFFARPTEVPSLIESGELEQWIKRSVQDEVMLIRYERALASAEDGGRGAHYIDRLIGRVSMAIDPEGPIRHKSISVTSEGFGTAIAEAYMLKRDLQPYHEMLSGAFMSFWLNMMTDLNYDVSAFLTRFDSCRNFLKQNGPGFGLERVLYFLNTETACLSPILSNYSVRSPEEFLYALDDMAAKTEGRPERIFDRHILAFLSARDRKVAEPYLFDISSTEPHRHALGAIQCLAAIQRYNKIPPLKNLSAWMVSYIEPLFERFHDSVTKKDLRKKVAELRDKGDLGKIMMVINNPDLQASDMAQFRWAMREYRMLVAEQSNIALKLTQKEFGKREGQEISVVVSGVIATLIIVGVVLVYMTGASFL